MRSKRKKRFNKLFAKLPSHVQKQARDAFKTFQQNPYDSSLGFESIRGYDALYSVRIGYRYRALGEKENNTITWYWIGTHEEYNHLI